MLLLLGAALVVTTRLLGGHLVMRTTMWKKSRDPQPCSIYTHTRKEIRIFEIARTDLKREMCEVTSFCLTEVFVCLPVL